MRRYSQRQNLSTLSEINITPLLDLAFVLLIIFMITTPLLESSMNLVIPSSGTKNSAINTSHVQTVSIDRTDIIRFHNQVMDVETLTTQLTQLKQTNPDIAIVIRPDRDLPVQKLIGAMDALQRAGITKESIVWLDGAADLSAGEPEKQESPAPKQAPSGTEYNEPAQNEAADEKPVTTKAKSEIQLPSPTPKSAATATPAKPSVTPALKAK